MTNQPKLMIPGPVDIWEETLAALGEQVLPYYGVHWDPIYLETLELLAQVFQTTNDIFILTAPGSGAVECCVASLFGDGDQVSWSATDHLPIAPSPSCAATIATSSR
ncbi:MAG: hypothetical protein HC802_07500 [Caldilineaceae bacterium]|nr:hypothetical protein [Caldilineaceae bacterium]